MKKTLYFMISLFMLVVSCETMAQQTMEINESTDDGYLRLTIKSIVYIEEHGKEKTQVNCEMKNISTRNMTVKIGKDIKLVCDNGKVLKAIGTDSYSLRAGETKRYSLYFDRIPYEAKTITYDGGKLKIADIDIFRTKEPPNLHFVENSFVFEDKTENYAIDADEKCNLTFEIINKGKGNAYGCEAITDIKGNTQGISFSPSVTIPTIKSGEKKKVNIPLSSNMATEDGKITLTVRVKEPMGFGTDLQSIELVTKKFVSPFVSIADYNITSGTNGSYYLKKKEPFDLQLMLHNSGKGTAEDVEVQLIQPNGVYSLSSNQSNIGTIEPGGIKSLVYTLAITMDYEGNTVPFKVKIREKYGKYSEDKDIVLNLNQNFASSKVVIREKEKKKIQNNNYSFSLNSDVDKDIPQTNFLNDKTYAIIIANEVYNKIESSVDLAEKDGMAFREYCKKTLGIPDDGNHIIFLKDATLNDMNYAIGRIKELDEVNEITNVIFYYAGHGIPDEKTKEAYLVPVDAYVGNISTSYSINKLYSELSTLKAENVFVFMDACFSGSRRGDGMIAEARSVAIAPLKTKVPGNIISFSAASSDQTAMPYKEKEHGLFTYFLLKKLKESKGNCTLGELGDYITEQVKQYSVNSIHKKQTPSINPSPNMQDKWRKVRLIEK